MESLQNFWVLTISSFLLLMILIILAFSKEGLNIIPLLKILPTLYLKSHQLYNKMTQVLAENNGTVLFKTWWFTNVDVLVTSDPTNVHHVMNSKFMIYQRGSEFRKAFDFLGEAIFIKDYDQWREEKKFTHGFYKDNRFHESISKTLEKTLEKALIPVLNHHSQLNQKLDLQDFFNRYMLDTSCLLATGFDVGSLRIGFPRCPLLEAMDDMAEAVFCRHILPETIWKLQRWLGIGKERKMSQACKNLNQILADFVSRKYQEIESEDQDFDVLKFYMGCRDVKGCTDQRAYLAANIMTLLFAGRDTSAALLTWFFHLISTNPCVENKILQEIRQISPAGRQHIFSNVDELNTLVYLHCALCETLRLFPTAPVIIRDPIQDGVLPSGHRVHKRRTKVILCSYAMGHRADIWGTDCGEFRPERWLSEKGGGIRFVASSSFLAFGSGPCACPGKELAFARMKGVVATILHNFEVRVLEGQSINPGVSAILTMKQGLKACVSSRWM